jgi:hypothetical protein
MVEGVNATIIYILIYCKNFCKCQNVPPPSTTIKIKPKLSVTKKKIIIIHSFRYTGEIIQVLFISPFLPVLPILTHKLLADKLLKKTVPVFFFF